MNEKIPQHVILDLLPLYLADEVSAETRNLIEEYLKTDPQLATLAEQAKHASTLQEIPAPITKETEMEALKKVKKMMLSVQHHVFLAFAVITTFMVGVSAVFLWDEPRGPQAPYIFGGMALIFWIAFFLVNKKISD
jgi:anti-sigma factor RsiW